VLFKKNGTRNQARILKILFIFNFLGKQDHEKNIEKKSCA